MVKLIKIEKSEKKNKKWKAIFKLDSGKEKTTHFGYNNPNDLNNSAKNPSDPNTPSSLS